jgi:hypothetical protein
LVAGFAAATKRMCDAGSFACGFCGRGEPLTQKFDLC